MEKVPHRDVDGNLVMLYPYKSWTSYISEDVWAVLIFVGMCSFIYSVA
jgi:hypothetical protein